MKKILFPIVLVVGFVSLVCVSVQATTATACAAKFVAADSTPEKDTTKTSEAAISADCMALVAADSVPQDTTPQK
jgi:hypothetical protein